MRASKSLSAWGCGIGGLCGVGPVGEVGKAQRSLPHTPHTYAEAALTIAAALKLLGEVGAEWGRASKICFVSIGDDAVARQLGSLGTLLVVKNSKNPT